MAKHENDATDTDRPPGALSAGDPPPGRTPIALSLGFTLLALALLLVGALSFRQLADRHEAEIAEQLRAIAALKIDQIERWLAERRQDAEILRTSEPLIQDLSSWLQDRNPQRRERILERLDAMRRHEGFLAIMIVDASGTVLLNAGGHTQVAPALRETAARALASGRVEFSDFYRDRVDDEEHVHLDLVAPIPIGTASDPVLVLRLDQDQFLFPYLREWPLPSASAETLLVRRDGESTLFLNPLRRDPDAAVHLRLPLEQGQVLASLALSGRIPAGEPIEALDYRGTPVLGIALPVAGTAWYLITKIDRAEIAAAERADLLWIGSVLGLTLALAMVSALLLYQRQSLRLARKRQQEQAARLDALRLLDAVADASGDAIFAKDLAGNYRLFNRAAARFCRTTPEAVLGHDDRSVFPPEQAALTMASDRQAIAEDRLLTVHERVKTAEGEITLQVIKGPLHDADGRIVGTFGISRDITERARAEEENRRQLEELRRWHQATLGRESRILELKGEVNALLAQSGQCPRYPSAAPGIDLHD